MLAAFDSLRCLNILSIFVRMLLVVLCGGIIGIEREFKRRPAGFRTHILICLGAAITTLTSQYLLLHMHYNTDVARMGAQVIAGIGFIGAGTIIVTQENRVKGLTTAAGLWASAIVGLAIGLGFYEGAIFSTIMILVAELLFSRLEYQLLKSTPEVALYVEYTNRDCLDSVLRLFREFGIKILNIEIARDACTETKNACSIFSLRLNKKCPVAKLVELITTIQGVLLVELL